MSSRFQSMIDFPDPRDDESIPLTGAGGLPRVVAAYAGPAVPASTTAAASTVRALVLVRMLPHFCTVNRRQVPIRLALLE
jgi:hypothetical protein